MPVRDPRELPGGRPLARRLRRRVEDVVAVRGPAQARHRRRVQIVRLYDSCRGGCMAAKFFTGLPLDGPDPECVQGYGERAGFGVRVFRGRAAPVGRPLAPHRAAEVWTANGRAALFRCRSPPAARLPTTATRAPGPVHLRARRGGRDQTPPVISGIIRRNGFPFPSSGQAASPGAARGGHDRGNDAHGELRDQDPPPAEVSAVRHIGHCLGRVSSLVAARERKRGCGDF